MRSVLLTNYYSSELLSIIKDIAPKQFEIIALETPTQEDVIKKIPNADYLLVGGRIKIDQTVLGAASRLKMIQRTGVGLDSIDLDFAKNSNIPIYVNPGINSRSVAEHSMMLLLAVLRNVSNIDTIIKSGIWKKHELGIHNHELYGKTVGLIGLGNIGMHMAKMLQPFGVNIIYTKRERLDEHTENALNLQYVSLKELLTQADIISIHCPHTKETDSLLSWDEFSAMKRGVILINTSRGKIINEEAMIHNLKSGHVKAAGLDVFAKEPIPKESELLKLENVIVTPHVSGITHQSFTSMMQEAFKNIKLYDMGKYDLIKEKILKL